MFKLVKALMFAVVLGQAADAALLVTYDFNSGNAPSFVQGPLSAGAFVPGSPLQGAGLVTPTYPGGPWSQAYQLASTNNSVFTSPNTFTITSPIGVLIQSISFDLGAGFNLGQVQLSNDVTSEIVVFNAPFNSFANKTATFATPISANSITFTLLVRSTGGNFSPAVDNVNLSGVVPEPASMGIFAALGALGLVARKRRTV